MQSSHFRRERDLCAGLLLTVVFALGCIGPNSLNAEDKPVALDPDPPELPWERASVKLGAFFSTFDSNVGFSPGGGLSTTLNAEDTLGLDSSLTVFRLDALYRIGRQRKHQVDFSYASYHRSGETILQGPIDIGGGIIIPAVQISSELNFDVIRLNYSYAFIQTEHVRVAGGLGLYVLPIEYGLEYEVGTTPPELQPRGITVPVPALALRADFRIVGDLYVTTELSGLYLNLSGFEGTLFDAAVAVEYRIWKHLALGVGYNGMLVDIRALPGSDYPGADAFVDVDVSFHGAMVFAKVTF